MPEISRFYGIVIRMYCYENHGSPHIHAKYGDDEASFAIETGEAIIGYFPRAQTRLVQAWIEIHKTELLGIWREAVCGKKPHKIDPLQ